MKFINGTLDNSFLGNMLKLYNQKIFKFILQKKNIMII